MTNEPEATESSARGKLSHRYTTAVAAAAVAALLYSVNGLGVPSLDLRYLLLVAVTAVVSSRFSVQLPRINASITVADTFVFLALMLYGPEPAVVLSSVEGACSGLRASRRPRLVLFNASATVCATFVTAHLVTVLFGRELNLGEQPVPYVLGVVCAAALAQYLAHTGIGAVGMALMKRMPFGQLWKGHYLWTSITYFFGAFAAGLAARYDGTAGVFTLAVALPVVTIIYFTYEKYFADIRASAAQAEAAERERAEQAERHVEELSRYVGELERMSAELQKSREHFRHAAYHDALTGLPNRALFLNHLELAVGRARRVDRHHFAVLFLDLDRFKNVNDSLGHMAGDQLLMAIARRLERVVRPADTVARTGGDEYAILLDGLPERSDAVRFADRLQEEFAQPFALAGQEVFVTASVGIALSDRGCESPENYLRDADTAMYRAKEKGKARYEVFDAVMHARAERSTTCPGTGSRRTRCGGRCATPSTISRRSSDSSTTPSTTR